VSSGTASPAMTPTRAAKRSAGSLSRPSCMRSHCHWTVWPASLSLGLQAAILLVSCCLWASMSQLFRSC
jgi:hypothetical protein